MILFTSGIFILSIYWSLNVPVACLRISTGNDSLVLPPRLDPSLCPGSYGSRPVLLVALDGFRADYLQRGRTPIIQKLADGGVHPDYMMSSFPAVTFPNLYTIVTGLYPEAHGIIGNYFFDPLLGKHFYFTEEVRKEGFWWGGEPIWNTLARKGKNSASVLWPGSEAHIKGRHPTFNYNGSIVYEDKVAQVLKWLSMPVSYRPAWVSLYIDEPDLVGHASGPDTDEINYELENLDRIIQLLMQGLIVLDLIHCVNIIILSDHGMAKGGYEKVIYLDKYLDNIWDYTVYKSGSLGKIYTPYEPEATKLEMLQKLVCQTDPLLGFRREGMPKRLHFSHNARIGDILAEVDSGYTVSDLGLQGQHGYDNYSPTMNALFIAYGPDFKQGIKAQPFQNIELYNLMCHLTGVSPAANNGTWGSLHHMLANPPPPPALPKVEKPLVLRVPLDPERLKQMTSCDLKLPTSLPWVSRILLTNIQGIEAEDRAESLHTPWGIPQTDNNRAEDISLLYHSDRVIGFSSVYKTPIWTSFTLMSNDTGLTWVKPPVSQWINDVRVPTDAKLSCETFRLLKQFNYSMVTIFPTSAPAVGRGEITTSHLMTNAIPVHHTSVQRWFQLMHSLLHWRASLGPLNVVLGPVFDRNDNPDIEEFPNRKSIPSDLFAVVTRCLVDVSYLHLCPPKLMDSRSFILHQYQPVQNCFKSDEAYLTKFSATVRDVERATGLTLFPSLPFTERVSLGLRIHPHIWPLK